MGEQNNRDHEALSVLMDNETSELELRRTLKTVSDSDALRGTWHRYQLAAAAMRRDLPPQMIDLSSRISNAIDQEDTVKRSVPQLFQPLGKAAIAASVAIVAVFGVQQFQLADVALPGNTQQPEVASAPVEFSSGPQFQLPAGYDLPPVTARIASAGSNWVSSEAKPVILLKQPQLKLAKKQEIQRYLNDMMHRHTERSVLHSNQGMMPYARLPQEVVDEP